MYYSIHWIAFLLMIQLVAAIDKYFISERRYPSIRSVCGPNASIAMATHYNLDDIAIALRAFGIKSAFVAGWNMDDRVSMRIFISDEGVTVNPHDDDKSYHIVCYGAKPSDTTTSTSSKSKSKSKSRSTSIASRNVNRRIIHRRIRQRIQRSPLD